MLLALALTTTVLLFLGGGLADDALGKIGLGDTFAAVWQIARWPAAVLSAMLIYAIVFYTAPNVEVRRWRYITPIWLYVTSSVLLLGAELDAVVDERRDRTSTAAG